MNLHHACFVAFSLFLRLQTWLHLFSLSKMPPFATHKNKPPRHSSKAQTGERKINNVERKDPQGRSGKWRNTMCRLFVEKRIKNQLLLTFGCQESSTQLYLKTSVLPWIVSLSNRTIYFLHQTLINCVILRHFPKWWYSNRCRPELKAVFHL